MKSSISSSSLGRDSLLPGVGMHFYLSFIDVVLRHNIAATKRHGAESINLGIRPRGERPLPPSKLETRSSAQCGSAAPICAKPVAFRLSAAPSFSSAQAGRLSLRAGAEEIPQTQSLQEGGAFRHVRRRSRRSSPTGSRIIWASLSAGRRYPFASSRRRMIQDGFRCRIVIELLARPEGLCRHDARYRVRVTIAHG